MVKSNLKYKSNLYVLKGATRTNDRVFLSKITDPDLLKKIKRLGYNDFSKLQERIIKENTICSLNNSNDPCWGKKGNEYICKCVNIDCEYLDKCRKGEKVSDDEYYNFTPELYEPIDYEYNGICKEDNLLEQYNASEKYPNIENEVQKEYSPEAYIPDDYEISIQEEQYEDLKINIVQDNTSSMLIELTDDNEEEMKDNNFDEENLDAESDDVHLNADNIADEYTNRDYEFAGSDINFANFRVTEQKDIIEADASESFLVNAGPGTGKTYTLIQKINNLVKKQEFSGDEILVLSYTNAAVNEVKIRLNEFVKAGGKRTLRNVDIRTFDSFAWKINQIAKEYPEYVGKNIGHFTYDKARKQAAEFISKHPEVLKDDMELNYFIVDEIQDLTDDLGLFVLKIIRSCKKQNIPFALFGDSCQAIYDYNEKNCKKIMSSSNFYEQVFKLYDDNHNFVQLIENYRQKGRLKNLTTEYRQNILSANKSELKRSLKRLEENMESYNTCSPEKYPSVCFLTRTNGQALKYASKIRKRGLKVTINASTQVKNIKLEFASWISKVLYDYEKNILKYEDFEMIVKNNNIELPENYLGFSNDAHNTRNFWEYLLYISNQKDYIDVNKFIKDVSESKIDDPILKFITNSHTEVSTVHKAKGREFDEVYIDNKLYSNLINASKSDMCEHKIMYVALTRPKYVVNRADFCEIINTKKYNYKRWYIKKNKHISHIEICDNDIDINSFVIKDCKELQTIVNGINLNDEIYLKRKISLGNVYYEIYYRSEDTMKDYVIGKMNQSFTDELREITKINTNIDMPGIIDDLCVDGIYTYFNENTENHLPALWTVISFTGLGHLVYDTY